MPERLDICGEHPKGLHVKGEKPTCVLSEDHHGDHLAQGPHGSVRWNDRSIVFSGSQEPEPNLAWEALPTEVQRSLDSPLDDSDPRGEPEGDDD